MKENTLPSYLVSALENPEAALIEISRLDCEDSLAEFVKQAWQIIEPGTELTWNWHLDVVCAYLEAFFLRRIRRLILNIPPGTMKSVLVSVMGPAWAWTRDPTRRFINLTNEIGLATRDNQRMMQIIQSDWYVERWGHTFSLDQRKKTHFSNDMTGFRQGLGISGNITGKRGTDLLIDDPIDAKKAFSDVEIAAVNDTYDQAVSSRLNNLAKDGIVLIMQRLRTNDLTGHLLAKKRQKWTHVRIPMEYEPGEQGFDPVADLGPEYEHLRDPRKRKGQLLFPERFPREEVEILKEDLGEYGTAGQLQQRPNPLGGGVIKKVWWRKWPKEKPLPLCLHVVASWDTAYTERDHKDASYSARTTWGIFEDETTGKHAMLLLSAWHDRVDYPKLRKLARSHHKNDNVDRSLVEKKASGQSLLQDMRRGKIPVYGYDPGKLDKVSRAYLAQPAFEAGLIYYVERVWAEEVIDYVADFPNGAPPSADYTDTVSQAVLYLKRGWWITPPDEEDEPSDELENEDNNEEAPYG